MHILLTGASGQVGSHTLIYLLRRNYTITALDLHPLSTPVLDLIASLSNSQQENYKFIQTDLTDYKSFEKIIDGVQPDTVIHLGAIPDPKTLDFRDVHNINVTSSYNVLQTCASRGIKRVVQASSVNATGLSYSPEGHHVFQEMPVTENHPMLPVSEILLYRHLRPRAAQRCSGGRRRMDENQE
jgi:nucleoside-diphosphate-sugar epimerase